MKSWNCSLEIWISQLGKLNFLTEDTWSTNSRFTHYDANISVLGIWGLQDETPKP